VLTNYFNNLETKKNLLNKDSKKDWQNKFFVL
jgi:hypothetical protein